MLQVHKIRHVRTTCLRFQLRDYSMETGGDATADVREFLKERPFGEWLVSWRLRRKPGWDELSPGTAAAAALVRTGEQQKAESSARSGSQGQRDSDSSASSPQAPTEGGGTQHHQPRQQDEGSTEPEATKKRKPRWTKEEKEQRKRLVAADEAASFALKAASCLHDGPDATLRAAASREARESPRAGGGHTNQAAAGPVSDAPEPYLGAVYCNLFINQAEPKA
jgi:hypothetical protein